MTEISFFSFSLSAYCLQKIEYFKLFFRLFLPEKNSEFKLAFQKINFSNFLQEKNPKISILISQFLDYQMILIQLDHKHFINECFEI